MNVTEAISRKTQVVLLSNDGNHQHDKRIRKSIITTTTSTRALAVNNTKSIRLIFIGVERGVQGVLASRRLFKNKD